MSRLAFVTALSLLLVVPGAARADEDGAAADVPDEAGETVGLRLRFDPSPPAAALVPLAPAPANTPEAWVRARSHDAPLFSGRQTRYGRGTVRRGAVLPAEALAGNDDCGGRWLRVPGAGESGYVCTSWGFSTFSSRPETLAEPAPAREDAVMPYRYGFVNDRSAFRFTALPSARQRERLAEGNELPGLATRLNGDYYVALDGEVERDGVRFVRTVRGEFVEARFVEAAEPTRHHGAYDPEGLTLPLAFVYREGAQLLVLDGEGAVPVGRADKYARAPVVETAEVAGEALVRVQPGAAEGAFALRAADVRVARAIARPAGIRPGAQWVHVDLARQVLVAYEGDRPVFATLVASGREGYETPSGLYRVRHEYVSTTMRGEDPVDGPYDVAEVPWTMYYHRSFALHGAYWHDGFGEVRSHGCTNLAPVDARFLFLWGAPELPAGWHGVRAEGFFVYNTN